MRTHHSPAFKAKVALEELIQELYRQIGQLKVELDWLKKNLDFTHKEKKLLIEPGSEQITISRQAELVGISRSSIYYAPVVDPCKEELMRLIDEQYTLAPFYGSRKIAEALKRQGHEVNRKRIQRLMRLMGIEAIYPKPNLSRPHPQNKIYPYLLKGVKTGRNNQVWGTDITYIRLQKGWAYLVAIIGLVQQIYPVMGTVGESGSRLLHRSIRAGIYHCNT